MSTRIHGLICGTTLLPIPLTNISNNVTILDTLAVVRSILVYRNDKSDKIEANFVFPMDDDSAVFQFEVEIDGKHIIGELQEKEHAKDSYQEAIRQGNNAYLLGEDETAGDIFRMGIGCLRSKKTARIKLAYVVQLHFDDQGAVQFNLPAVLNPRYIPTEVGAGSSVTHHSARKVSYDFSFQAEITSKLKIKDVVSELTPIELKKQDDNRISVTLPQSFSIKEGIDLRVIYDNPHKSTLSLEPGSQDRTGILQKDVIMLNFYPKNDLSLASPKAEFIFLIDRSGSMRGNNMNQAKATLLLFLKSLPVGCLFNIIGFGSNFSSLFPESQEYNEGTLQQAIELHKKMKADLGGTEIMKPLKHIFEKCLIKEEYPRQLFVLTDGQVSNTSAVINLVKAHASHTRLFAFGIGIGVSTSLVKGIARAGKGKAEFVTGSERLQPKIISCLKLAAQPATTAVSIEWDSPNGITVLSIPEQLPVLFAGEHLVAFGIIQKEDMSLVCPHISAILRAKIGDQTIEEKVSLCWDAQNVHKTEDLLLHRIAAKAQIKQLELAEDQDTETVSSKSKQKSILLSLASNIISKYTAFFGVDLTTKEKIFNSEGIQLSSQSPDWSQKGRTATCRGRGTGAINKPMMQADDGSCSAPRPRSKNVLKKSKMSSMERGKAPSLGTGGSSYSIGSPMLASSLLKKMAAPLSSSRMAQECEEISDADTALQSIISLQHFDGSWELNENLLSTLKIKEKIQCPVMNGAVWATILVIAWLKETCMDKADEWEMIGAKAEWWLQKQPIESPHSVDSLVAEAIKCF